MTNAIPGNVRVIGNECDRLTVLADLHDHGRQVLQTLRTQSWTGPSADGFGEVQRAQARSWAEASDCYAAVSDALARHADVLGELQRLADSVLADAQGDPLRTAAAEDSLRRWTEQAKQSAADTARIVRAAGERLGALGQPWQEWTPDPIDASTFVPPAKRAEPPAPSAAPQQRHHDPLVDLRSPEHGQAVQELSDKIWRTLNP
ncbi:MAG TPA: hypothetical protein VHZ97_03980 [Pseudonocardiaceae bacterium]|nr:hypothetical protein [Pseudonocardiaceae bacterium]